MANDRTPKKPVLRERRVSLGPRSIITRGLEANIWTDAYHASLTVSWPVFIGAAASAFIVLNAVFGALYALVPGAIANADEHGLLGYFFFSIETIASVGYGDMHPQTPYGHTVASIEIFVGLFSVALLTGLIFARFSQPRARIIFAQRPVVSPFEGQPSLMLRVANARTNMISDASAKLWFMRNVTTAEGTVMRRSFDLALVRTENPMFVLSWSIFHIIDAASPLFGLDAAALRQVDGGLILSISGHDETSAQMVRARQIYPHTEIAWGHHYSDILETSPAGLTILNYHLFHEIRPVGGALE